MIERLGLKKNITPFGDLCADGMQDKNLKHNLL